MDQTHIWALNHNAELFPVMCLPANHLQVLVRSKGVGSTPRVLEHHVVSPTVLTMEQRSELRLPCLSAAVCHPGDGSIPVLDDISCRSSSFVRSCRALLLNIGAWQLINARCAGVEAKRVVLKSKAKASWVTFMFLSSLPPLPSCSVPPGALSRQ